MTMLAQIGPWEIQFAGRGKRGRNANRRNNLHRYFDQVPVVWDAEGDGCHQDVWFDNDSEAKLRLRNGAPFAAVVTSTHLRCMRGHCLSSDIYQIVELQPLELIGPKRTGLKCKLLRIVPPDEAPRSARRSA